MPFTSVRVQMLNRIGSVRRPSHLPHDRRRSSAAFQLEKPDGFLPQLKFFYDKYHLRNYAPFILLFLYSLMGAYLFYVVEHDHEQEVFIKEQEMLAKIRNDALANLTKMMSLELPLAENTRLDASRDILHDFETKIFKHKLPEALHWDMLGALFYVGTVFTTIGYGNITPRTKGGQALSMVYALFGIPLVFAILSQFGKTLTRWVSAGWVRYRKYSRSMRKTQPSKSPLAKQRKWSYATSRDQIVIQMEKMDESVTSATANAVQRAGDPEESEEAIESRTIPIWLALFVCIAYICACAGLFCIWETKWSYFTSLYFIFISLSTIGLGDVVPDHPHMLILMFWLVIIGLSIVSMLLSVIQIKMEEWLYHLLIKMRQKYHQALENGELVEGEQIFTALLENEPWYMRNMATHFINETQAAKIEEQAETFERVTREFNNKNIQTDEDMLEPVASPPTRRSARSTQQTGNLDTDLNNYVTAPQSGIVEVHRVNEMAPGRRESDSDFDASSIPMDCSSSSDFEAVHSLAAEVDLMQTCLEELAPMALEELNRRFLPQLADFVDCFAQTEMFAEESGRSFRDVEVECELLVEPTRPQTSDQSQNTTTTETAEMASGTPAPSTHDAEVFCRTEQEDKAAMTSAPPTPVDRAVSPKSVGSPSLLRRSIRALLPSRSRSAAALSERPPSPKSAPIAEKRRRFSATRGLPGFDSGDLQRSLLMAAVGTQCSASSLVGRPNEAETAETSAQYSPEPELPTLDQSSQATPSLKRRQIMDVGLQPSVDQGRPAVSEFATQSTPTLHRRSLVESGAQYSQSIDAANQVETSESGTQCGESSHATTSVGVQGGESIDFDEGEANPAPRSVSFQAKVIRSSSTISLRSFDLDEDVTLKPIKESFDVVLQTEDSYLKIARKLEEYRSIRTTQSLHICATRPTAKMERRGSSRNSPRSPRSPALLSPESAGGAFQFSRKRSSRYKKGERRVSFQTGDTTITIPDAPAAVLAPDRPEIRADSPLPSTSREGEHEVETGDPPLTPQSLEFEPKTRGGRRRGRASRLQSGGHDAAAAPDIEAADSTRVTLTDAAGRDLPLTTDGYETDDESGSEGLPAEIELRIEREDRAVPGAPTRVLRRTKAIVSPSNVAADLDDWQREAQELADEAAASTVSSSTSKASSWWKIEPGVQVGIRSVKTTEILPPEAEPSAPAGGPRVGVSTNVMVATSSNVRKTSVAHVAAVSNRALRFAQAGVSSLSAGRKTSEAHTTSVMTTSSIAEERAESSNFSQLQRRKASLPALNIPAGIVGDFRRQHERKSSERDAEPARGKRKAPASLLSSFVKRKDGGDGGRDSKEGTPKKK